MYADPKRKLDAAKLLIYFINQYNYHHKKNKKNISYLKNLKTKKTNKNKTQNNSNKSYNNYFFMNNKIYIFGEYFKNKF